MAIVHCPACSKKLKVADTSIGKKVKCSCGEIFVAHADGETSPAAAAAVKVIVACTECGAKLKVANTSIGKKMKCPKCEAVFVAAPEESVAPKKTAADVDGASKYSGGDDDDARADMDDEEEPVQKVKSRRKADFEDELEDEEPPRLRKFDNDEDEKDEGEEESARSGRRHKTAGSTVPAGDEKPAHPSRLMLNIVVACMILAFICVCGVLVFGDAIGPMVGVKEGLHADLVGMPNPTPKALKKAGDISNEFKKSPQELAKAEEEREQKEYEQMVKDNKEDIDKLNGVWIIDQQIAGEGAKLVEGVRSGDEFAFSGYKLTTTNGGELRYKIDQSKTPKEMELNPGSGKLFAIYRFKNGKLEIYAGKPELGQKGRPTAFADEAKDDKGQPRKLEGVMLVLPRKKGQTDVDKADLKAMRGTWVVESFSTTNAKAADMTGKTVVLDGSTITHGDRVDQFVIDATKNPKEIDLHDTKDAKKPMNPGIYKFDQDSLVLYFSNQELQMLKGGKTPIWITGVRPTSFEPKQGTKYVLKREAKKPPTEEVNSQPPIRAEAAVKSKNSADKSKLDGAFFTVSIKNFESWTTKTAPGGFISTDSLLGP